MLTTDQIIMICSTAVICVVVSILIFILSKRFQYVLIFVLLYSLMAASFYFNYNATGFSLLLLLISLLTTLLISFSPKLTSFRKKRKVNTGNMNGIDLNQYLNTVNDAVLALSSGKTGALMTFEKDEDLSEFIERGNKINAELNSELLRTIFYPGTPLHDGAVIIRGNTIMAGSVFFTPTTKALPGKFGARHRAAIGFSKDHSSITVVVSEETGRISLALNGELIHCTHETFRKRFEELITK